MSKKEIYMTILLLPWYSAGDQELTYSSMKFTSPEPIKQKKGVRFVRNWYKKHIGRSLRKRDILSIWKKRMETKAMSEEKMNDYLNYLATESYEEIKKESSTTVQEKASSGTGG